MNRALFRKILQPNVIIAVTVMLAVVIVSVSCIMANNKPSAAYVQPTRGSIIEEVDTTGTVAAADTIDLSFQTGGAITYAGPAVGSHIGAGTTLASLSGADLRAQLEQAQAGLAAQKAQLAGLQAGATPQSVAVAQTGVTNAQNAIAQAKLVVIQALRDAYVKSDDAIHNKVDQIFANPRSYSPTINVTSSNSQLSISAQAERVSIEQALVAFQASASALPSDPSEVDVAALIAESGKSLFQVSSFLDLIASLLSSASPSTAVSSAQLEGYKSAVATARATISAAVTGLSAAQTSEQAAESNLATAQSQLALAKAPPTQNAVDAQQAAVAAAQANVDLALAQIGKTYITAPIAGTITVNNAHVGSTASAATTLISMISDTKFQLDAFISEADVAKVRPGNVVSVSLDAYQDQAAFSAHVISVDPAATVTNGTASYKVTIQFDGNDSRIQAGMRGSAHITTATHADALSIPTSAIITRGTTTFVIARSAHGADTQTAVTAGIESASGMTEILSGLSPSVMVRTFGSTQ